jgi:hypothetical protein
VSYWVTPEDVSLQWAAKLIPYLPDIGARHGNCQMYLVVMVSGGIITAVIEPVFRAIEPRSNHTLSARSWWSVIRRMQSVTKGRKAMVTMNVSLNGQGNPVLWTEPEVRPLA